MSGVLTIFASQSTSQPTQCADVTIQPNTGVPPVTVLLSTTTPNAHIFYRKVGNTDGADPTHTGDNAGVGTNRIGSNSGFVNIGAGVWTLRALAYEPSHLDSNITEGDYEPSSH